MVSAILLHYVIDDPLPTRGTFGDPGTNSGVSMVSAILLHYVIDDPLPTRGTFGDPGTNSGADNFFFWL